jgi:hypothetical protein
MQAGLTTRRLTFREIFSSTMHFLALRNVTFVFFDSALLVDVDHSRLSMGGVTTLDGGSTGLTITGRGSMQAKGGGADSRIIDLDSQPRVRLFSLECTQLLTEDKNLKGEVVARTEESAQAAENEKWNHGTGFVAQGAIPASALIA